MTLFWFRRDLRLEDNHGLLRALELGEPVQPIFIFDQNILNRLSSPKDARVSFIHGRLLLLQKQLQEWGADLWVFYGNPLEIHRDLLNRFSDLSGLVANRDYEPYGLERDREIYECYLERGLTYTGVKDQVVFDRNEVLKDDGTPYTVFTPYSRKWRLRWEQYPELPARRVGPQDLWNRPSQNQNPVPSLESMGFEASDLPIPASTLQPDVIKRYHEDRNRPDLPSTSRLGLHLRFGTLGIRTLLHAAHPLSHTFVTELIWRDFYQSILYHFPQSANQAIKPAYDRIEWERNEEHFTRWCTGTTGYPLVDAGMRELNETGFMHNRVRMVVASFLTKHLLLDWRWGERYFAEKLLDFDLASNVGGWQWASGSGCDAAPYFRIFNPSAQLAKFDPQYVYVKQWVSEWGTPKYPTPVVDHAWARERALARYKAGLNSVL